MAFPSRRQGSTSLPLAASNFFGPVLLAPLFDTVGRRKMICGTYGARRRCSCSLTAVLLSFDVFTAWTQTLAWMVIFFFASAAASSAYLTGQRNFSCWRHAPLRSRSFTPSAPPSGSGRSFCCFGFLIGSGAIVAVAGGYAVAAVLMLIAAAAEFKFGIDAEGRSLESIAEPLSSA